MVLVMPPRKADRQSEVDALKKQLAIQKEQHAAEIKKLKAGGAAAEKASGWVYLIRSTQSGSKTHYKIGRSATRWINNRMKALEVGENTKLIYKIHVPDMADKEKYFHKHMAHCRLPGSEWFNIDDKEDLWDLIDEMSSYDLWRGIPVKTSDLGTLYIKPEPHMGSIYISSYDGGMWDRFKYNYRTKSGEDVISDSSSGKFMMFELSPEEALDLASELMMVVRRRRHAVGMGVPQRNPDFTDISIDSLYPSRWSDDE